MMNILSNVSLEILYQINDYLKYFSKDIDDFSSIEFKQSEVKEVDI